jgi:RNA polymerase sigma-70 factor (ECF subfamily)
MRPRKKVTSSIIDSEAFLTLLEPLKHGLYNFILKAVNFSEDGDDVYQETVLRAFKYIDTYDSHRPFKAWIFSVAYNQIKSYYKQQGEESGLLPAQLMERIPEAGEDERVSDIFEVAAGLEPKQRSVFFFFYYNRFSIREISEITGLSEGNVKFILNAGRKSIRKKMEIEP